MTESWETPRADSAQAADAAAGRGERFTTLDKDLEDQVDRLLAPRLAEFETRLHTKQLEILLAHQKDSFDADGDDQTVDQTDAMLRSDRLDRELDERFDRLLMPRLEAIEQRLYESLHSQFMAEGKELGASLEKSLSGQLGEIDGQLAWQRAELEGQLAQHQAEFKGQMAQLRAELKSQLAQQRADFASPKLLTVVEAQLAHQRAEVTSQLARQQAELDGQLVHQNGNGVSLGDTVDKLLALNLEGQLAQQRVELEEQLEQQRAKFEGQLIQQRTAIGDTVHKFLAPHLEGLSKSFESLESRCGQPDLDERSAVECQFIRRLSPLEERLSLLEKRSIPNQQQNAASAAQPNVEDLVQRLLQERLTPIFDHIEQIMALLELPLPTLRNGEATCQHEGEQDVVPSPRPLVSADFRHNKSSDFMSRSFELPTTSLVLQKSASNRTLYSWPSQSKLPQLSGSPGVPVTRLCVGSDFMAPVLQANGSRPTSPVRLASVPRFPRSGCSTPAQRPAQPATVSNNFGAPAPGVVPSSCAAPAVVFSQRRSLPSVRGPSPIQSRALSPVPTGSARSAAAMAAAVQAGTSAGTAAKPASSPLVVPRSARAPSAGVRREGSGQLPQSPAAARSSPALAPLITSRGCAQVPPGASVSNLQSRRV